MPEAYRKCHSFSDFWKAYAAVLPEETHRSVGKESGETAHMEHWNNTLRQRIARFVREDPLLLQEELVARSSDPLVHRRIQPVM